MQNVWFALDWIERGLYASLVPKYTWGWWPIHLAFAHLVFAKTEAFPFCKQPTDTLNNPFHDGHLDSSNLPKVDGLTAAFQLYGGERLPSNDSHHSAAAWQVGVSSVQTRHTRSLWCRLYWSRWLYMQYLTHLGRNVPCSWKRHSVRWPDASFSHCSHPNGG